MNAPQKFQMAYLALIAVLFSITPLLSTSYLYLLLNLLIIISLLGTQTGLLSFYNKKPPVLITQVVEESSAETFGNKITNNILPQDTHQKVKKVKVSKPEKQNLSSMNKKCPSSNPSLFFIGGGSTEEAEVVEETVEKEEEEGLSGEELFDKAEMFIGNFYKQLKIQREESWKRIHHGSFYQKAF
ncbi:Protein of unknown function DUF761 [Macleaya cordata]|uniref:DUF4408 domain-containing protein n=1 Tax=Macleaya cordata TaxID=56857 RepID=A0A200PZ01_MACCD|nr:Protein of unknown function DUF761 [Macleaya cordata]